jgi:hypothetical protein
VEPIALQAGVAPRTLQEFLAFHRWDREAVRDCLQGKRPTNPIWRLA